MTWIAALLLLLQIPTADNRPPHRSAEAPGVYDTHVVQAEGQVWPLPPEDGFLVFDALGQRGSHNRVVPEDPEVNALPVAVVWPQHIFDHRGRRTTLQGIEMFFNVPGAIHVYNFEQDPIDARRHGDEAALESADRLAHLVQLGRRVDPSARVGLYMLMPLRDYWTPNTYERRRREYIQSWQQHSGDEQNPQLIAARTRFHDARFKLLDWRRANRLLGPLARELDYVCPSLYIFYPEAEGHAIYAEHNLREAASYNKPIYPFVNPRYHTNAQPPEVRSQPVPLEVALPMYREIDEHADGVILWSGGPTDDPDHWRNLGYWLLPRSVRRTATLEELQQMIEELPVVRRAGLAQ
jgi:hypothetical protein